MKLHYTIDFEKPVCGTLATFHSNPCLTKNKTDVKCKRCLNYINDTFPKGYDYEQVREKNRHLRNSAASKKETTKGVK